MNKYESVIIIKPNIAEDIIKEIIEKVKKILETNNGTITKVEEIGLKKLAYEIQKSQEGYYIVFEYEIEPTIIAELERYFRITEDVLKFLTIRKDD